MTNVDYLECTNGAQGGTGVLGCEPPTGVPTGVITTPKNWVFDPATETFDNAYIKAQIKAGVFTPFLNAVGYENQDEAAEIFTTNTKVKIKSIDGKPGFALDFKKNYHFHTAAYNRNSFNAVDVLLVYDNGSIFAAHDGTGKIKAHTVGIFDTMNFKHADGSAVQKTTIMFQLTEPKEYNTMGAILNPSANNFNLKLIRGVVDAVITKISNATVTGVVKVMAKANGAIPIKGLTVDNFQATGTTVTIDTAVFNAATNEYTLTFSADVSAQWATLRINLFDTADSTTVVEIASMLYQGATA